MNRQIEDVLTDTARQYGVKKEEVKREISETWRYICENPRPEVRKFGLSLMEGDNPPPPSKIAMYLALLTLLCNSAPLVSEPNADKRMDMAMEEIINLHHTGRI